MHGRALARYTLRAAPQHFIVHVTNRCYHRCAHCFTREADAAEMPLSQIQELGRQAGHILWLDIGGGEPFIRPDLAEIVSAFHVGMVQIPTSGAIPGRVWELTQEILLASPAQLTISVSLDGDEAFHDKLRGNPKAFDAAWATLEMLLQIQHPRLTVKVNTVLMSDNMDQVLPLMRKVRQKGPAFHSVILLRGEGRDPGVGLPPLADLRRLGPEILSLQGSYDYGQGPIIAGMLRRNHRALWQLSLQVLEQDHQVIPCLGGRVHLNVWSDGKVAPCELLPAVGDLNKQTLAEILQGERLNQARAAISAGHCACTHNCALLDSVLFNPKSLGKLLLGR